MSETPAPFPLPDGPPDPVAPWQPEPAPAEPAPAEPAPAEPEPAPADAGPEPEPAELDRFHGLEPAWLREAMREVFARLAKLEG
jgi:hypothetical protein